MRLLSVDIWTPRNRLTECDLTQLPIPCDMKKKQRGNVVVLGGRIELLHVETSRNHDGTRHQRARQRNVLGGPGLCDVDHVRSYTFPDRLKLLLSQPTAIIVNLNTR